MRPRSLLALTALAGCLVAGCFVGSAAASSTAGPSGPVPAPTADLALAPKTELRTAVFAAGCFWCVEAVFEAVDGVTDVVSGYAGDGPDNAQYEVVGSGRTKHAESVKVTYDASKITYGQLIQILFVTSEPTVKDRQGPDAGHQYRFTIFTETAEQKRVAEKYIAQLTAAKTYAEPIQVTLEDLKGFYPAEAYHQDYVRLHPNHPYVRAWSVKRVRLLLTELPQRVKPTKAM